MRIDKCPVCNTVCMSELYDHEEKKEVDCERCGKYKISIYGLTSSRINNYKNGYAVLSNYIKKFYNSEELLDEGKINSILENHQLPAYEKKYHNFLTWLANESDYSTKSIVANSNNLASILGAADGNEVVEIVDDIWTERLIEVEGTSGDSLRKFGPTLGFQVHLTSIGIKKIKGISQEPSNVLNILSLIDSWNPINCIKEKDFENSLYNYLHKELPEIQITKQYAFKRIKADIAIGDNIIIEIKNDLKTRNNFQRLIGQLTEYKSWEGIIILLLTGNTDINFLKELKDIIEKENRISFNDKYILKSRETKPTLKGNAPHSISR